MRTSRFFLIALVSLFFITLAKPVSAQKNFTAEADHKYEMQQYFDAIQYYKKAYTKVDNKLEKNRIMFQLAMCYYLTNDMKNAENQFRKVINKNYSDVSAKLYLAKVLMINEKYEEAVTAFEEYKKVAPDDPAANLGIESAKLAKVWMDNPTQYKVEINKKINTKYGDFAPVYFDKKYKTLVFTTAREEVVGKGLDAWTGQAFTDLFYTQMDNKGNWKTPMPLDEDGIINTPDNEGACTFNSKYNTMYFTRCRSEKKKQLGCQILTSEKKGKAWGEPTVIPITTDSFSVGHPALTEDELTLIFASNMPGSIGGKDLWMMTRSKKNKEFENPVNLGSVINTTGDELYPTIREVKGKTYLYFSSNGLAGMGGLDIYRSELVDGKWSVPENMKYPINSSFDDFHMVFNDDAKMLREANAKEMGFLSTNRKGGKGGDDIWSFSLPPVLFTLSGVVKDDSTRAIIVGAEVRLEGSDGTLITDTTDKTGTYKFTDTQILENTTYNLIVSKPKYFSEKGKETTVGLDMSKDLIHDFFLVPIPVVPIVLPDIYYDLAKWDLKPQYEDSLRGLVKIMKENPTLVIELGSHTDTRSSDEYNDTLSFKRAKSCVDFIIAQGVEADRIVPKGYGERVPRILEKDKVVTYNGKQFTFKKGTVVTDDYIATLKTNDEKEAAHQLNRRTTFQILRNDYVPSADKNTNVNIQIINEKDQPKDEPKKEEPKKDETKPGTTPGTTTTPKPGTGTATTPKPSTGTTTTPKPTGTNTKPVNQ